MKGINDILLLGDTRLYQTSESITETELPKLKDWVTDLDNVMNEIRKKFNFGRAIAAPQLGIMKKLVYMNIDKPVVIINPEYTFKSNQTFEVWDDCMSFPNLFVKVKRHNKISIKFRDENWQEQNWTVEDDISELLQHEFDHLDGILAPMRAIDNQSFKWRR